MTANSLRLFTIQSEAAYEVLATSGVLRQVPECADTDFADAYAWMRDEMNRRLPTIGETTLWFWAQTTWRALARQARTPSPTRSVLIEARVPGDLVLLSDFGDWHMVLNRRLHVPQLPRENLDAHRARAEPLWDDFDSRVAQALPEEFTARLDRYPDGLRAELEASWTKLFVSATWPPRAHVQGVTHQLHAHQIVRVLRLD